MNDKAEAGTLEVVLSHDGKGIDAVDSAALIRAITSATNLRSEIKKATAVAGQKADLPLLVQWMGFGAGVASLFVTALQLWMQSRPVYQVRIRRSQGDLTMTGQSRAEFDRLLEWIKANPGSHIQVEVSHQPP